MNDKWLVLNLRCEPPEFTRAFGSPCGFYRALSNDKKKVGYHLSQRDFWKRYIAGGFYACVPAPDGRIHFVLVALLRRDFTERHIQIRLRILTHSLRGLESSARIGALDLLEKSAFPCDLRNFSFLLHGFGTFRGKATWAMERMQGEREEYSLT